MSTELYGRSERRKHMIPARVGYFIDGLVTDRGGTEKQLLRTIEALDRERFEPTLILLSETPWTRANRLPCPSFVLHYQGFLSIGFPGAWYRLRTHLKERRYDILHVFFEEPLFLTYMVTRGASGGPKVVASRRDIGLPSRPWYHYFYEFLRPRVLQKFAAVLVNGRAVKERVVKHERVRPECVRVIYNGIDLPEGTRDPPRFFLDHSADLWIAVVANLNPVKRHDIFLHALRRLTSTFPERNIQAFFLGSGPEESALHHLASNLGLSERVHFVGAVSDVDAFLQRADIGVLCSDREGLSNAVMEYMACGLPAVVTNVGGNSELVDETNGFCVPKADPEVLFAALATLVASRDLRSRLGARSREKIEASFSWKRTLFDLEAFYDELLAEGRRHDL